ncbi:MAG: hypothetical protein HY706_21035 [Candidatus Hydrogenedentes bacterium]|nr:hypothetical protein [Candidatus Hydrogenedentota bacterium]
MLRRRITVMAVVVACAISIGVHAQGRGVASLEKKLIEYGWDVPTPDFIRTHIQEMEQRPFDGLIFKLKAGGNVLEPTAMPEESFAEDYENVRNIPWNKFTDNFAIMWAASAQDWFDDSHWQAIESNVRLVTRAARLGRCVGICFDPEPYGKNPWSYQEVVHRDAKSFIDYDAKAKERGGRFVRAIQQEMPWAKILMFYQMGLFAEFCVPMSPETRAERLAQHDYALFPAFLEGMLTHAGAGVMLIDGNEPAYYYTDRNQYFDAYHTITQRGRYLFPAELQERYRAHVQAGQALYIDQYFGLRTNKTPGRYMTPEERPKWFEHNVYWALHTADQYVWCYSERMNWWTNTDVPPGCEDAIRAARDKIASGQPLDFDLAPIIEAARTREREEQATPPEPATAP